MLNLKFKLKKIELWIVLIPILLVILVLFPYFKKFDFQTLSNDQSIFGVFGDYFGGVLNPFLTFFTLVFLLWQWGETKKREDSRDKRELEFETLNLAVQKSVQEREADRDRREEKRDSFAKDQLKMNWFIEKIKLLDEQINNLSYRDLRGIDSIVRFNIDRPGGKLHPQSYSFVIRSQSVVKSLNSLFEDTIRSHPLLVAKVTQSKQMPNLYSLYRYDLLATHFSKSLIHHIAELGGNLDQIGISFSSSLNANYLIAIQEYIEKIELMDLPHYLDEKSIDAIFKIAESIKTGNSKE